MRSGLAIPGDWFPGVVPANVRREADTHIDTAYSLVRFRSARDPGLTMKTGAALFGDAQIVVGHAGEVTLGHYSFTSGMLICAELIEIGAHCMIAWGSVITDCWPDSNVSIDQRRAALIASSADPARFLPLASPAGRIVLEDSVWVGFGAVILPGVTVGQGSIIGARTVLNEDVPAYSIVAGNPPRIVGALARSDTPEARSAAVARLAQELAGPGTAFSSVATE